MRGRMSRDPLSHPARNHRYWALFVFYRLFYRPFFSVQSLGIMVLAMIGRCSTGKCASSSFTLARRAKSFVEGVGDTMSV